MSGLLGRMVERTRAAAPASHALQPRPATAYESPAADFSTVESTMESIGEPSVEESAAGPEAPRSIVGAPPAPVAAAPTPKGSAAPEAPLQPRPETPEQVEVVEIAATVAVPQAGLPAMIDEAREIAPAKRAAVPEAAPPTLGSVLAAAIAQRAPVRPNAPSPATSQPRKAHAVSVEAAGPSGDQVVQVTIGRIDVRAAVAAPPQRSEPQREPMLTLTEYLRDRR